MANVLSGFEEPLDAAVGDRVVHYGVPGFTTTVLEVAWCSEADSYLPHNQYKIVDPEGNDDWVCGWDLRMAEGGEG